jgi:hypothetical protein
MESLGQNLSSNFAGGKSGTRIRKLFYILNSCTACEFSAAELVQIKARHLKGTKIFSVSVNLNIALCRNQVKMYAS